MIKVSAFAYARVQVPDLEIAQKFFHDFGLATSGVSHDRLYLRGTGPAHHLIVAHRGPRRVLALAFEVAAPEDLQKASLLHGASEIRDIDDIGGGRMVTLTDPDGNHVELVTGIEEIEPAILATRPFNFASERARLNAIVRPPKGPSRIMRIGHAVLRTANVERMTAWYQNTLGLLPSDEVPLPDGSDLLMSFVRLDQGDSYVDHHVFQALKGAPNQVHHISFEVQDIDDLHMGHRHLAENGYKHMWGVGRHLQGSQIFDYWLDPFGTMYEHWTDTDLFNAAMPKNIYQVHELESPWGPAMPEDFLTQGTE